MKKVVKIGLLILLVAFVLVATLTIVSYTAVDQNGLEYTLNDNLWGYSVTGIGTCTDTDNEIPSKFSNIALASISSIPNKLESAFGLDGNGEDAVIGTVTKLDTPANLELSDEDILTFIGVPNANGYEITFKTADTSVTVVDSDTEVDLSGVMLGFKGYGYIDVVAISNNKAYAKSDAATYIVSRALTQPTNISLNASYVLTFNPVPHATGYVVTLADGTTITTSTESVNLYSYFSSAIGTTQVKVRAVDPVNNKYLDSSDAVYDVRLTYTVTYNNDGTVTTSWVRLDALPANTVTITLPTFTKSGYTFKGWHDGTRYNAAGTTVTITSDMNYTAGWTAISTTQCRVEFIDEDGNVISSKSYSRGTRITLPSIPGTVTGYWLEGSTEYAQGASYTVTGSATFYAQVPVTYIVTLRYPTSTKNVSVTGVNGVAYYTPPTSVANKSCSDCDGHEFIGWSVSGVAVGAGSYTITSDGVVFTAHYSSSCAISGSSSSDGTSVDTDNNDTGVDTVGGRSDADGTKPIGLLILLVVFVFVATLTIVSYNVVDQNGLKYTLNGLGSYSVTGIGTCTNTDIVIPSKVKGRPVTGISHNAFENCTSLRSIVIPDSVTNIGDHAFGHCTSLTSITFEGAVEHWNAIKFSGEWNCEVPATEVVCSNGTAKIK